jgi:hypothetical protein
MGLDKGILKKCENGQYSPYSLTLRQTSTLYIVRAAKGILSIAK